MSVSPSVDRVAERIHFVCTFSLSARYTHSHLGDSWTLLGECNWWHAHHTLPIQDNLVLSPTTCTEGHFRKHVLGHRSNGWLHEQTVNQTSSACIIERLTRGWPRTQVKNAFVCAFSVLNTWMPIISLRKCLKLQWFNRHYEKRRPWPPPSPHLST